MAIHDLTLILVATILLITIVKYTW
jgi:hypothetical protein